MMLVAASESGPRYLKNLPRMQWKEVEPTTVGGLLCAYVIISLQNAFQESPIKKCKNLQDGKL